MILNHADDVMQFHFAERTPPFALLVPNGQTPEMFALHQHHFAHRRQGVIFYFTVRGRRRICHTLNIGRTTATGSPDFVKNSTTFGIPDPGERPVTASGVANHPPTP